MVIGITGGVGSGKSEVLSYLRNNYDACILQMDETAKELIVPGGSLYEPYIELFGEDIVTEDKTLDRRAIAAKLFADPELAQKVNALVHPVVIQTIRERIAAHQKDFGEDSCIVVESALPKEGNLGEICDTLWYIHTSVEVRVHRLMISRGYSREKCLAMIESQLSEEDFRKICDIEIDNSGAFEETIRQIREQMRTR